jgi:hypothetical protein
LKSQMQRAKRGAGVDPDPPGAAAITDATIDAALLELRRAATAHLWQNGAAAAGRHEAESAVRQRADDFDLQLRRLLAFVALPAVQRGIYQRPEMARPTRDALDRLIVALEEWQRETDPTALFDRNGKPWPGHIDLPGAVDLARAYAVIERDQQSARITRGNQPKPALDAAVWQLCGCWEIVTGSFPRPTRAGRAPDAGRRHPPTDGDSDGDSSHFAAWARETVATLAPDLAVELQNTRTGIAQAIRRIEKERKAAAERAKDPTRGLRQIIA